MAVPSRGSCCHSFPQEPSSALAFVLTLPYLFERIPDSIDLSKHHTSSARLILAESDCFSTNADLEGLSAGLDLDGIHWTETVMSFDSIHDKSLISSALTCGYLHGCLAAWSSKHPCALFARLYNLVDAKVFYFLTANIVRHACILRFI